MVMMAWVFVVWAGAGILKLRDDVQTCGYQDVQVMWEMLLRSEMELSAHAARRKRLFWKAFVWPGGAAAVEQHHHPHH
ncbi:hypothetical protein Taro_034407 [Colocasia esculenta]|uniref:Uncharacterized protein n=1 Tax=Colocasia esculenta TaxID=4460 RepID=A0A843WBU1_COLES|nr:hypothetical protein [Colocasia esculenta]